MTDLASWLQAFAAIVALGLSTWSVLEARAAASKVRQETRADVKAQNDLRAKMIASTIVIELEVLSGDLQRLEEYLGRLPAAVSLERRVRATSPLDIGSDMVARAKIDLPTMLDRNLDRLHWLGDPLGAAMLLLMSLVFSLNGLSTKMMNDVISPHGGEVREWLVKINPHLRMTRTTLAQVQKQVLELIEGKDERSVAPTAIPWYKRPPK